MDGTQSHITQFRRPFHRSMRTFRRVFGAGSGAPVGAAAGIRILALVVGILPNPLGICERTDAAEPLRLPAVSSAKPLPAEVLSRERAPQTVPSVVRPKAKIIAAERSPIVAIRNATPVGVKQPASDQSTPRHTGPNPDWWRDSAANSHSVFRNVSTRTAIDSTIAPTVAVDEALNTRGSVTFRKTAISEVVFLLSDLWKINIVAGENVNGEVSGSFHDAPLREVLAAVLTSSGYSYRKTGSSLVVLPSAEVGMDDPSFVSETLTLPLALREDASSLDAAAMLLSERGKMSRIGSDTILVIDSEDRIERLRMLFSRFQTSVAVVPSTPIPSPTRVSPIAYFTPQFIDVKELQTPLTAALGDQVGIAIFPEENRLMIKGNGDDLELAREVIDQLDRPREQVRITAMIYDVGVSELEECGVNWTRDLRVIGNARNEALAGMADSVSDALVATSDLTASGLTSIGLRTINDTFAASALLEALDNISEAKLLADPTITVADRREASIRIIRKIPIIGINPLENSNAVVTQTEFEEAGVILNVKPRISRDGTIELEVQPEYSVLVERDENGPVIDSRTAQTTVRVANGQMFVLGGLRQKSIVESNRGIPFLKDMKYFGRLFRSHSTEVLESELIVFLKPELITPYFNGDARQRRAACVSQLELDRIPHAEDHSMIPCCRDPNCPNHHPRPRANAGSEGLPQDHWEGSLESEVILHGDDSSAEIILDPPTLEGHSPSLGDAFKPTSHPVVSRKQVPTKHVSMLR